MMKTDNYVPSNLNEKELLEQALTEIVLFFQRKGVSLSKLSNDGRTNSSKNEEEVINDIKSFEAASEFMRYNQLKIGTPNLENNNNREWYDFSIESTDDADHNYFMPVNIKVTQVNDNAHDNLNCKLGIFYALTGRLPSSVNMGNGIPWKKYFELLDANIDSDQTKDYYFLVVDKSNTKDVFWSSLKTLNTIYPNGNNLPFQCKWSENKTRIERHHSEAKHFILKCFKESIDKRDSTGAAFRNHMNKYIKENPEITKK